MADDSNFSVLNPFSTIIEIITFPPTRSKRVPFPHNFLTTGHFCAPQASCVSLLGADILKYSLLEGTEHRGHVLPFAYIKTKMNLPVMS